MAKKKHSNRFLSIVGGVFVVLVIVSIAFASTYISSQLSLGTALAPNAPESEPEAAAFGYGLCKFGVDTTKCKDNLLLSCTQVGGDGQWTETETCEKGCCAGKCITKVICTPGKTRCNGVNIQTCDRYGGCWTNTVNCSPFKCNPNNGECTVCVPGEKKCSGNILKTCNSDGSKLDSTDCGIGKVCKNSACKSMVACNAKEGNNSACPGIYYDSSVNYSSRVDLCFYKEENLLCCKEGYFYMMSSCMPETTPTPTATATPTKEAPKPTATPTVAQICTPGASKCSGTYSYTCNSTGTAWGSAVNCSPYKVCNSSTGKCAAPIE